ncbi:DUF6612 family protein [Lactobacillus sp. PV034]|uniref:DUF6612 family protein n=1 Tax=Lactobacillus sp. PV034 TaxID=2594495 RepID=UPI00223F6CA3|nr:DUF6612 family protein [Lactobacillus sp. PV034]QNQ81060.1 hypothetical protein FP432_05565 [Lactobacillus sp. PV034]
MKIRRIGWLLLIAFLLPLSACSKSSGSHSEQTSNSSVDQTSKNQNTVAAIVAKVKKHPIENGYLTLNIELADGNNSMMKSNLQGAFRRQPFIMEMVTTNSAGEVKGSSKEWTDDKNIYLALTGGQWYKAKTASKIIDVNALKNNLATNTSKFVNPSPKIQQKMKLTNTKDKYILSLATSSQEKNDFRDFVRAILEMTGQNSEGLGMNEEILKDASLKNLTMKESINRRNYHVEELIITFEMTYKGIKIKEKEVINKIGKYVKLDVPKNIKKAAPLSEDVISKMNSINNT